MFSPAGKCSFSFALDAEGAPTYRLFYGEKEVVQTSRMAVMLKDLSAFEKGFSIVKVDSLNYDSTWKPVYADAADAHWQLNPQAYKITSSLVTRETVLNIYLAAGGGAAVRFKEATAEEKRTLKKY